MRPGREADAGAVRRFVPGLADWPTTVSALGPLVATRDEEVVGVLVRWPHPDHVLVELLAVSPAARREGVGALLLDVAEREALECGVNAVRSPATGGHVPLLLRRGYLRTPAGTLERRLAP